MRVLVGNLSVSSSEKRESERAASLKIKHSHVQLGQ